jgi:hypothetical protein
MQKIILIIGILLYTSNAYSECIMHQDYDSHITNVFENSTSVLLVKVTKTELINNDSSSDIVGELISAEFIVEEVFKGSADKPVRLLSNPWGTTSDTDMPLMSGTRYIIFSSGKDSEFMSACGPHVFADHERGRELISMFRNLR